MLTYLLFMTRIYLLNFGSMWKLPVLAFAVMLLFRLLWGGKQPCKGALFPIRLFHGISSFLPFS